MRAVVLVPYAGRNWDDWRERNWGFARPWWEQLDLDIFEGEDPTPGPFNRGAALNAAAADADAAGAWDVAVCIDADVICDMDLVRTGIDHAWTTGQPVIGYRERIHLTRTGTTRVLNGDQGSWRRQGMVSFIKMDAVSSSNIVRRDLWDTIEGYDPLFNGWGWEDVAFKYALEAVGGPTHRMDGTLWHLWHPNTPERRDRQGLEVNRLRAMRYVNAGKEGDRKTVLQLTRERHHPSARSSGGLHLVAPSQRTVILVPRRADGGPRDRLWAWLRNRLEHDHPDWPIYVGERPAGEPFNKSAAVNAAAEAAGPWEVAMIIDADSFVSATNARRAEQLARQRGRVTIAHSKVHYLSETGTRQVMADYAGSWAPLVASTLNQGCSSVMAVPRKVWEATGGMDEHFVGWGEEDVAFFLAAITMGGGHERVKGDAWHLWHPQADGERDLNSPTYLANRVLRDRYMAANGDKTTMASLLRGDALPSLLGPSRIPRRLIRTVPHTLDAEAERFWSGWQALHPGWEYVTWRDPIPRSQFPLTAKHWKRCSSGAQMAGLIRLEEVWHRGGVYVDSDLEPYRCLEPLLGVAMFAGWEDANTVPDFVFGAEAHHPAVEELLNTAIGWLGQGAWKSGPGVFTQILPNRPDVLLLPPGSFAPYHYTDKGRRHDPHAVEQPWAFAAHHWAHSWAPK